MKRALQRIEKGEELIAVYSLPEKQEFFEVGFLIETDEETIMLESYASDGSADGYLVIHIDDIYRIEQDSKYLHAMNQLRAPQRQESMREFSGNCVDDIICHVQKNNRILTINLLERDGDKVTGYVQEINDDTIVLKTVNEYGEPDGLTTVYKEDCSVLACESADDIRLEKLSVLY